MWERKYLALVAVGVLAALAAGAYLATRTDTITTDAFPDRLPTTTEYVDNDTLRTVEYYEDGITKKHAVDLAGDGTLTDYWYRPDGTLEKAVTQSPIQPDTGARVIIRVAEIMPDGETYKHDVEYFLDGTKSKEAVLTDPARLHRIYFHPGGATHKDQVIVRDKQGWKLSTESDYRVDGSLSRTYQSFERDAFEEKQFSEQGILVVLKKKGEWGATYTEINYQADGKTPTREVSQNYSGTTLVTRNPDGSKAEERSWFGSIATGIMAVTIYGANDRKLFYQYWMPKDGKYEIWTVKDFDDAGKDRRSIYYNSSNGTIWESVVTGENTWTNRYFTKDGLLYEEKYMTRGNSNPVVRTFTEADNIRVQVPAEWLVFRPFTAPDQVIPYVPQTSH